MNKSVVDWLLAYKTRADRTKDSGGFLLVRKKSPPLRPGYGLANLRTAALKQPEVMVKITRRKSNASNGLKGIRNQLDYISRNGEVEVENQDGEKLNGKKALRNQTKDWQKLGIPENEKSCEALNIVLSMPAGMPPQAVKNASSEEFAAEQFQVHQYAFALHTDSECPNEPTYPHVHLCVLMRGEFGQRLNPRKNDLFEWRLRFAEKMYEQGVPCAATRRQHRGVIIKEYSTLKAMQKRGHVGQVHKRQAQELIEALRNSKRPDYLFMKEAVQNRADIVSTYKQILKELYKGGTKTEGRLIRPRKDMIKL